MTELLSVCPDCGTTDYSRRVGPAVRGGGPVPADDRTYRCNQCGHTFDHPDERERQQAARRLPYGGRALAETDPDDLLPDGGRRPTHIGDPRGGVGDQDPTCVHGTRGCPGSGAGEAPCALCFFDGDGGED